MLYFESLVIPHECFCVSLLAFGEVFSVIGAREPQPKASEAFTVFAEAHRNMEKFGIRLLRTVKPVSLNITENGPSS